MKTLSAILLAMKLMLVSCLAALPSPVLGQAVSSNGVVQVEWDPSGTTNNGVFVPDTNVIGYILYIGPSSVTNFWNTNQVAYSNWVRAVVIPGQTSTNTTVSNLGIGQRSWYVLTAFDAYGMQSDFSNEINYRIPILTTNMYMIVGAIVKRARTTNDPWTQVGIYPVYQERYTNQPFGVWQLTPTVNLQRKVLSDQ